MPSFPLLNIWSAYSLLRSSWDIGPGLDELATSGYHTAGLADYQSLAAAELFSRRAAIHGIASWLGMTVPVAGSPDVAVYAMDGQGWQELCVLAQTPRPVVLEEVASRHLLLFLPSAALDLWTRVQGLGFGLTVEELQPGQHSHGGAWIPACPVRFNRGGQEAYQLLVQMGENQAEKGAMAVAAPAELLALYPADLLPSLFQRAAPAVLPQGRPRLPVVTGSAESDRDTLVADAGRGLEAWHPEPMAQYRSRLDYELDVILSMGFASYFLIVADLVRYAREAGIATGPGRGSAAGSLVARCLGITGIDPLEHGLLFERFLNPHRRSMPDIDLDVDFSKRYRLIEYLRQRWGADRVAQIGTYGTLGVRAVLREVARALRLPPDPVNVFMGSVRAAGGQGLAELADEVRPGMDAIDPSGRWLRLSLALEGLPRHSSVHAAGVVLSDVPLGDMIPCVAGADGQLVTQMDMVSVERLGLLKLDLLGLRALSVADRVRRRHPQEFGALDLADPSTLRLLGQGETEAVFQLDGHGVRELLQRMRPQSGREIIDVVALYRPGPMDAIGTYLARRAKREAVPADIFGTVCHDTYGVMVYQEQLMTLVQKVAGYSLADADLFRRAISKKDHDTLAQMGGDFASRARDNGWEEADVRTLWTRIMAFADYGFNKSHAAAYGLFSYYMAYLKAHYPLEFWAAEFSTVGTERLELEAASAVSRGIVLWPPDVTTSSTDFEQDRSGIAAGLTAVRGVSEDMAERIVGDRERSGPYHSKAEAFARIAQAASPRVAQALAAAGALGRLPGPPAQAGQLSLFDTGPGPAPRVDAVQSFGWAWPVASGPIYVRARRTEDASWWQRHLQPLQSPFPGPLAVIVGNEAGRALKVDRVRLDGSWQCIEEIRKLPQVAGCGRRIVKKKVWSDGEDITRGTD